MIHGIKNDEIWYGRNIFHFGFSRDLWIGTRTILGYIFTRVDFGSDRAIKGLPHLACGTRMMKIHSNLTELSSHTESWLLAGY
jgi:hypothetical protein